MPFFFMQKQDAITQSGTNGAMDDENRRIYRKWGQPTSE